MAKSAKAKKPSAPSKKPEKKTIAPKKLSKEFVQESEGEGEDSSSEGESLPENPADSITKKQRQLASSEGSSSSSEIESGSSSSSEEDEDTDGSDESEDGPVRAPKAPTVAPVPSGPYGVPPLFKSAAIQDAKQAPAAFKKYKSEGKQIWYFTAPASVPISSIKKMSLSGVKAREKVCSHDGNDYGFVQDVANDGTEAKIMVPHGSETYQAVSNPVDQIFHLQQIPKLHDGLKATVPAKKPVQPQPKGLKMRFLPLGYSDGNAGNMDSNISSEDPDDANVPKQFKKPVSMPSDSDEDSEAASDSDEEMTEAPPLPSKAATSRKQKSSKASPVESTANGSVKRKHSEVSEKKTKKSSSIPAANLDGKQLKRLKTKQTKPDKRITGGLLALARVRATSPTPPLKPSTALTKSETSIPTPKLPMHQPATSLPEPSGSLGKPTTSIIPPTNPTFIPPLPHHVSIKPQTSQIPSSKIPQETRISGKKSLKKKDKNRPTAPARDSTSKSSMRGLIIATDPPLMSNKRRIKSKELQRGKLGWPSEGEGKIENE
ncbi:uncharacterized protein BP5553_09010 [Venustampulla echinocandica]|uniref:Uncharacterized protein n=1 Tax=Venustampulla echinocandica TaxID=2656787 RepID=A0A370TDN9_9HELO|nr:uncharacterized protein BP5553_09010 [Venustampulla echinocandica]RDL32554.1 hypothetical protein BP5553_09010 [Venustampulla echinocandica]